MCVCDVWLWVYMVHFHNFRFCSVSNTWHFLYSALPDKNSKDYLKHCTKVVNSTVVVHYFAISSTVPWVSVNMVVLCVSRGHPNFISVKGQEVNNGSVTVNKNSSNYMYQVSCTPGTIYPTCNKVRVIVILRAAHSSSLSNHHQQCLHTWW